MRFPEDRGDPAGTGTVYNVSDRVQKNIKGVPYVWVTIRDGKGNTHTWPSNRLSR